MTPAQYNQATPLMDRIREVANQIVLASDITQISINWSEKPCSSITKRDSQDTEFDIITDAIKLSLQTKLVRLKKELEKI